MCSNDRLERARLKASLPSPFGSGLFKGADHAHVAWWASVSASLSDPLLFKLRSGLARFAEHAWQSVISLHGGISSKYWSQVQHLYPTTSKGLLDGSCYSPSLINTTKFTKIALKNVAKQKIELFQSKTSVHMLSDTLSESDIINSSSRSFAGRLFSEPIKQYGFAFGNDEYIAYCRFFLGLPSQCTVGGETIQPGYDYPVQKCLSAHGVHGCPYLDASGNHASSKCPSSSRAVHQKHSNIVRVIVDASREAGLETRTEPDTHSLLLGEFSKVDCRRVFPSKVTKAYKTGFENLSQASAFIASAACTLSLEEKAAYMQRRIDALPILASNDAKGLRVDASLINPVTGETVWIDAGAVHTSSPSYVVAELKAIAARKLSSSLSDLHLSPDALQGDPSPTLVKRQQQKIEKYSRLIMVAKKQHSEHKRNTVPKFMPFIVSDCGELAPLAYDLQEWIVEQFRQKCLREGPRSDGCRPSDRVREFRHELKVGVQVAVAAGLGSMIQGAGHAWGNLG